jgi:hypothetical protein
MTASLFSTQGPERLIRLCERLGYVEELRSQPYTVLTRTGVVPVDVACFGVPEPKDTSTATILASQVTDELPEMLLRESARALAAPIAMLDDLGLVRLWRIAPRESEDELLEDDLSEDGLAEKSRLLDALAPESLVAHKRGLSGQLALFDRDVALLANARANAGQVLAGRIEQAMASLWPHVDQQPSGREAEQIARTVVQALALLVVRDKMTADRSFDTALAVLQERWSDSVVGLTRPTHRRQVQRAAAVIGDGVRFDGLDATILGDVYEGTFLHKQTRQRLGAYYTPPAVARRMLQAVPVEDFPPEERSALDLTCGSGTLLLATWNRFADAFVPSSNGDQVPELVPGRLTGYDHDRFAVELARLALIIHDAPRRPSCRVARRNALRPRRSGEAQHSLLVGNPPWGFSRENGVPVERATLFLDAMFDWCEDDGFIACLLPASWMTANVARESRARVRGEADLLELWRLPETTFESSGVASCVLLARKRASVTRHWLYRRVHRGEMEVFLTDVRRIPTTLVDDSTREAQSPLSPHADKVATSKRLIDVAQVRRGVPMPKGKAGGSATGNVRFLRGYGHLHAFDRVGDHQLLRAQYPDDFSKRGESPDFWLRPKILMATTSNVDGRNRVRAFLDEAMVVPRNSMTAVVPLENSAENRLALLAILNSSVVSAWLDASAMRWLGSALIENIPMPHDETWPALAIAASEVVENPNRQDRDLYAVDSQVRAAYGLPPEAALPDADGAEPNSYVSDEEAVLTVGTVLDVEGGKVLLHIAGVTEPYGAWVLPPRALPGWACRPGAAFQVLGAEHGIENAVFLPQTFAWLRNSDRPELEAAA